MPAFFFVGVFFFTDFLADFFAAFAADFFFVLGVALVAAALVACFGLAAFFAAFFLADFFGLVASCFFAGLAFFLAAVDLEDLPDPKAVSQLSAKFFDEPTLRIDMMSFDLYSNNKVFFTSLTNLIKRRI